MYHQGKSPIHTPQHSSQINFSRFFVRGAPSPDHPASLPLAATSLAASVSRRCSLPLHRGTFGHTSIVAIATALAAALSPSSPPPPLPPPPLSLASLAAALLAFELCCSPCAITASLPQLRLALLASGPPCSCCCPRRCIAMRWSLRPPLESRPSLHRCHCPCHMLGYCVAMPRALCERVQSFVLQRWVNKRVLQSLYTLSSDISRLSSLWAVTCVWSGDCINYHQCT